MEDLVKPSTTSLSKFSRKRSTLSPAGRCQSQRCTPQVPTGPSVRSLYAQHIKRYFHPNNDAAYQPTHAATNDLPSSTGKSTAAPPAPPQPLQPAPGAVQLAARLPLHALGWHSCHGHGAGSLHPQMSLKSQTRAKLGA